VVQLKNWWDTVIIKLDLIDGLQNFGRKWQSFWLGFTKEEAQDCRKMGVNHIESS
jgi:hypothetical protein